VSSADFLRERSHPDPAVSTLTARDLPGRFVWAWGDYNGLFPRNRGKHDHLSAVSREIRCHAGWFPALGISPRSRIRTYRAFDGLRGRFSTTD